MSGVDYNIADLSERTLRKVYLPPFQAAIQAGCATVMAAFEDVAGRPVHGSGEYLIPARAEADSRLGFPNQ